MGRSSVRVEVVWLVGVFGQCHSHTYIHSLETCAHLLRKKGCTCRGSGDGVRQIHILVFIVINYFVDLKKKKRFYNSFCLSNSVYMLNFSSEFELQHLT